MGLFLNTYCEPERTTIEREPPRGAEYDPPLEEYYELASRYSNIKNFIFTGRDLKELRALFKALAQNVTTKKVYFVEEDNPELITKIKGSCRKEETLVVAIDETGNTPSTIRSLLALHDYQKLIITPEGAGALKKIQEAHDLAYAPLEDLETKSLTAAIILPAALLYINTQDLIDGIHHMQARCRPYDNDDNPALALADCLRGRDSETTCFGELRGFERVLARTRACTQERVFIPIIAHKSTQDIHLEIPFEYKEIKLENTTVGSFEGLSLHQARLNTFERICEEARKNDERLCTITLENLNPRGIGELLAFWEYVRFYEKD